MKRNILYSFIGLFLLGIAACQDDEIHSLDKLPEGETIVNATVEFNPLTAALATRSAAGDVIKNIESLVVLAYDIEGNFVGKYTQKDFLNYHVTEVERKGSHIAETKTPRATFQLKIPYGYYHLYAVANMGDLEGEKYREAIATSKGLKAISLTWDKTDVKKNNQMFGHFTPDDVRQDDSQPIRIGQKGMILRAGIRRLASKVTLAFDGSLLHEGVFVYIKSAQIKDIPDACFLGDTNKVTNAANLIENGDVITYAEGIPYDDMFPARITKGRPYYPHNEKYEKAFHSETEQSLFFYENMQGVHKDKDKRQNPDKLGKKEKGEPGYKDDVPNGTYIEVKAYYHSKNPDKVGAGEIIYRFMLGKDVINDFNSERNHHYKLTMKFKNFANDVDWHIDYEEEEPGIQVPEIYYISYLYNHSMMMPVKINTGGYDLIKLEAKIDTNSWSPYKANKLDYFYQEDPFRTSNVLKNYTGFLSLTKTSDKIVPYTPPASGAYCQQLYDANNTYYTNHKQGERTYKIGESGSDAEGKYFSKKEEGKNVWNFQVPMYTRAKQLVIQSGHTGNNPYDSYRRKAVVTFTATLRVPGGEELKVKKKSTILQERRLVNPKGIWRKHNNAASFHVLLKYLPEESDNSFKAFTSEGKWRAYVLQGDRNFVKLNGKDTIQGSTGSFIDFNINLNGTIEKNQNRFAIVQVDYHDYSCQHLIFVRQGDEPVALVNNGTKWLTYNMRTQTQEAESPCDEGSMFKFGNWSQPIDATENVNDNFANNATTKFRLAGTTNTSLWKNITGSNSNGSFSKPKNGIHVATYADFQALYENTDIENGYGVLYGNDATETLNTVEEVYHYCYNTPNKKSYGMRGCFVYNSKDARHLFFPIGASGYGHRKDGKAENGKQAVLRYASLRSGNFPTDLSHYAPLFYDLYRRPGAIYWLQQKEANSTYQKDAIAWDINYFSFDFNMCSATNLYNGNNVDACFIRCVKDEIK